MYRGSATPPMQRPLVNTGAARIDDAWPSAAQLWSDGRTTVARSTVYRAIERSPTAVSVQPAGTVAS